MLECKADFTNIIRALDKARVIYGKTRFVPEQNKPNFYWLIESKRTCGLCHNTTLGDFRFHGDHKRDNVFWICEKCLDNTKCIEADIHLVGRLLKAAKIK